MTDAAAATPVFPLGSCLLPGDPVGLVIFEDRYLTLISRVLAGDGRFASVLISEGSEVGGHDRRLDHGVLVDVMEAVADGPVVRMRGVATSAWSVDHWLADDPHPSAVGAISVQPEVSGRGRWDVASALSLVAQSVVSLRALVAEVVGTSPSPEPALARVAGGRWWAEEVSSEELWSAYWDVARCIPCGALDRHSMLAPVGLPDRVRLLRAVTTHVEEVARFRLG